MKNKHVIFSFMYYRRYIFMALLVHLCVWISRPISAYGCYKPLYGNHLYSQKPAFYAYILGNLKSSINCAGGANQCTVAEYGGDVYVTPASCQKIVTALLAYKVLGTHYKYSTNLYVTEKNNQVHDLIISFTGDPTLTSEKVLALLLPFKKAVIKGRIILDPSLFQAPLFSEGIMVEDLGATYCQPVSAMNIDHNLIYIKVAASSEGRTVAVTNDMSYKIKSLVVVDNRFDSSVSAEWEGNVIVVKGTIRLGDTQFCQLSPVGLEPYIRQKVMSILEKLNIKGEIVIVRNRDKLPKHKKLVDTVYSNTLDTIIAPAMKISDNFVFDCLYLKMVHKVRPTGVESWQEGSAIIHALMRKHYNVNMGQAGFWDGSGLSRRNKIQLRKLFELLQKGYHNPAFVAALPTPGEVESTLYKRNSLPFGLRAKTGSLASVSLLCGYITEDVAVDNPKVFVMAAHNFPSSDTKEICTLMDNCISTFSRTT